MILEGFIFQTGIHRFAALGGYKLPGALIFQANHKNFQIGGATVKSSR